MVLVSRFFIYLFLNLALFSSLFAAQWHHRDYVKLELIKGHNNSDGALIALQFDLADGWKIYNNQPQDVGFPTEFSFANNNNIQNHQVYYPKALRFDEGLGLEGYGYKETVLFPIRIITKHDNMAIKDIIEIKFALCNQVCIPVTEYIEFSLIYGEYHADNIDLITQSKKPMQLSWLIILSAFIAGLLLNFMPCVLPIVLLKITAFLEKKVGSKREIIISSASTMAGIFFAFMIFAIFAILLKLLGYHLGWGLHFQEPLFIGALIIILLIFACNIWGFFAFALPQNINKITHFANSKNVIIHHFFTGILVTILATPCSVPFLGTAVGFALTTGYINIILIFAIIALGLATPYILLIIYPKLLNLLPKPGMWMTYLKQLSAIFLIATALWLLWVLKRQIGGDITILFTLSLVILFLLLKYQQSLKLRFQIKILIFVGFFVLQGVLLTRFVNLNQNFLLQQDEWLDFQSVEIAELLKGHKGVFVNVTADWCLTCKFNEFFIFSDTELQESFKENNIALVKADYTNSDFKIRNYLHSFGRYAVPTYVIYNENYPEGKLLSELNSVNYLKKVILDDK